MSSVAVDLSRQHKSVYLVGAFLFSICIASSGCSIVFPSHSNSNHRNGEKVTIQLINVDQLTEEEKKDYKAAFPPPNNTAPLMEPVSAAAAAALVGFAIDFVAAELKQEATLYEAQFGDTIVAENFWDTKNSTTDLTKWTQSYVGFRIIREVKAGLLDSDDEKDGLVAKDGLVEAFRLVCGFAPSDNGLLFRVAPLQFCTKRAKAKVLSDELWWWLLPTAWLGKILKHEEHEIDTQVEVEMDAYWRGKDDQLHVTKIAGFPLEFKSYDITQTKNWRASDAAPRLSKSPKAFFLGVPVSKNDAGQPVGAGAFTLKILVTERDKSNAAKFIKRLSELIAEQKKAILEKITGP